MCDFVIFGGTGDLAVRKFLPALYRCDRDGRLPDETRVIATARAGLDDAGSRDKNLLVTVPRPMFPGSQGATEPNRLALALQPNGGCVGT